ncbi:MAG: glycoside hydrolase family 3 C-terminal domain-containing protein [Treponema sp.]|jgi:beta-glucosidase|nr:glycoside hydrolase family 3 C-terminal domain-containing protein [Treponema sp.]
MNGSYPFRDPALPAEDRIADLISRLTREEKAAFISTSQGAVPRLGIPAYHIGAEGAHGFVDRDGQSTAFPQTMGLSSSWDRGLLKKIGRATGIEARAYYNTHEKTGGLSLWSPTIDMARDPRWGRTEEAYGEDPFLAGELSTAYIQGAQGDDPYLRVSCAPKHFLANNNERGRGVCSCSVPERVLREYYLEPFRRAFLQGGAYSLMTAYNEVNGIPMMIHPLVRDVVKKEWGLEKRGHIVTDGGDFLQTVDSHHYFETHAETIAAAFKNGSDCMTDSPESVIPAVLEALDKNLITGEELDGHVANILRVRFRYGQFDPEGRCPYDRISAKDMMTEEHCALAREAMQKSVTLLKNEGNLLPLSADAPAKGKSFRVAVAGPLANVVYQDWYTGNPPYYRTPLDGLREAFGKDAVTFADYRDVVSFASADGRPLILAGEKSVLSLGKAGDKPARFFLEDWGWGACTLTSLDTGLLLETPLVKNAEGAAAVNQENPVTCSAKSTLAWFGTVLFNLIPQKNGFFLWQSWDDQPLAAPQEKQGETSIRVSANQAAGTEQLFKMTVERRGFDAVREDADNAETVILCCGNNPMINGRETVDRPSLDLPPRQEELIRLVASRNPRTVLALIASYPYTCGESISRVPAALYAAHGMQGLGRGLADIITGKASPAGRLTMTWYQDEKQLPPMMEYDIISAGSTYQYFTGPVLYPFGYGLSYSSFTYSDLRLDRSIARADETVTVSFTVKNTGSVPAEEVPQLYVSITPSRVRRPVKTLKGFDRIFLAPGGQTRVSFELPAQELAYWDAASRGFRVESGQCAVSIGASSADIRLTGGFAVAGEAALPRSTAEVYAETFDAYQNCFLHEKRGSDIPAVFTSGSLSWLCYASCGFGGGARAFSALVTGEPGSRLEIRLDAPDGPCAAVIPVPRTDPATSFPARPNAPRPVPSWAFVSAPVEAVSGIRDVYLMMYGKMGVWQFSFE